MLFNMRIIKLAVISIIVIFLILTGMGLLLPSHILVSRAVDIRGSVSKTKELALRLQNWQQWMTDAKGDKAPHVYTSNSLSIGATVIRPVTVTDSTFITSWTPGNEMTSTLRVIDHHTADSLITVQWQMEQKVKWYFWEKFASITKDEIWGGAMEKSLENLKVIIEAR
jgi:hypothetical protein